jgi:WhiB family redox-sensing transcriptional regulator
MPQIERARCADHDPEWWFPISEASASSGDAATAKSICKFCPLRELCLQFAADTRSMIGIWGGVDQWERQRMVARGELVRGARPEARNVRIYKRANGNSEMANMVRSK